MRSGRVSISALVALILAAPASAAPPLTCTTCDRPDLPDQDLVVSVGLDSVQFVLNAPYTVAGYSYLRLGVSESDAPFALGKRYMSGSNMAGTRLIKDVLFWELFEPDKIQRSASKTSLSQKNRVAIGLYHYSLSSGNDYAFTYTAASVEGCSASASFEGKKGAASWQVQCGTLGSLLDTLGVPSVGVVRPLIPLVMDTAPNKKLKLGAKATL